MNDGSHGPYRSTSPDTLGEEHFRVGPSGIVLVDVGLDKVDGDRPVLRASDEAPVLYGVTLVLVEVSAEVLKSGKAGALREGDMVPAQWGDAWQVHTAASVTGRWPMRLPRGWLSSLAGSAGTSATRAGSTLGEMEWRVGPGGLARVRWPVGQVGRDRKIHWGEGEIPGVHAVDVLIEIAPKDQAPPFVESPQLGLGDAPPYDHEAWSQLQGGYDRVDCSPCGVRKLGGGGGEVNGVHLVDAARNACVCTTAAVLERWPVVLDRSWVRTLIGGDVVGRGA